MPRFSRAPKYQARPVEYRGERYSSKAEAAYAKHLDGEKERGAILAYVRQPKFTLGCPENVYRGDFLVIAKNWVSVDDPKGTEPPAFRKVRKLWARYGELPLRVVKLKLRYPTKGTLSDPAELPTIRNIDYEVIHGGLDKRTYGPLSPEWLRS